jgi:hypothetical protein
VGRWRRGFDIPAADRPSEVKRCDDEENDRGLTSRSVPNRVPAAAAVNEGCLLPWLVNDHLVLLEGHEDRPSRWLDSDRVTVTVVLVVA